MNDVKRNPPPFYSGEGFTSIYTLVFEALRFDIHTPNIIRATIANSVTAILHQKSVVSGEPVNHCVA